MFTRYLILLLNKKSIIWKVSIHMYKYEFEKESCYVISNFCACPWLHLGLCSSSVSDNSILVHLLRLFTAIILVQF